MFNTETFETHKVDGDFIHKATRLWYTHIDSKQANWMRGFMRTNQVQDETKYFNYGVEKESEFYNYKFEPT